MAKSDVATIAAGELCLAQTKLFELSHRLVAAGLQSYADDVIEIGTELSTASRQLRKVGECA